MKENYAISDVRHECAAVLEKVIADRQPTQQAWIVQAVVASHPLPEFEDAPFYRVNAYESVRIQAGHVLRRYKLNPSPVDAQLALPGFPNLQQAYSIERGGEQNSVPIEQLTYDELTAKAKEMFAARDGFDLHGHELIRYRDLKYGSAQTA